MLLVWNLNWADAGLNIERGKENLSNRTGACSCKATRYKLTEDPMFTHVCHCSICKRHTGTAFVTHVFIEAEYITLEQGQVEAVDGQTGSGGDHLVYRCPDCQSALYSHYGGNRKIALVKGGTLDDPGSVTPGAHLWVEAKVPGIDIPPNVPAFSQNDVAAEVWPAAALERRKKGGWG